MPVVKFNAFFLNVIFGYQFHPFGKTQSLSLFKLEGLIKDNIKFIKEFLMVVNPLKSAIPVLIALRILLWAMPILLIVSFVLYALNFKNLSKFIEVFSLVCNLLLVVFFAFGFPYFISHYYSINKSYISESFSVPITTYFYIGFILISFVFLGKAEPKH